MDREDLAEAEANEVGESLPTDAKGWAKYNMRAVVEN